MFIIYSLYIHCIFTIYSLYVHYMITICSQYVHYMFTKSVLEFAKSLIQSHTNFMLLLIELFIEFYMLRRPYTKKVWPQKNFMFAGSRLPCPKTLLSMLKHCKCHHLNVMKKINNCFGTFQ